MFYARAKPFFCSLTTHHIFYLVRLSSNLWFLLNIIRFLTDLDPLPFCLPSSAHVISEHFFEDTVLGKSNITQESNPIQMSSRQQSTWNHCFHWFLLVSKVMEKKHSSAKASNHYKSGKCLLIKEKSPSRKMLAAYLEYYTRSMISNGKIFTCYWDLKKKGTISWKMFFLFNSFQYLRITQLLPRFLPYFYFSFLGIKLHDPF